MRLKKKSSYSTKCWRRRGEIGPLAGKTQKVLSLCSSVWRALFFNYNSLHNNLTTIFLGIRPWKIKTCSQEASTRMCMAHVLTISPKLEITVFLQRLLLNSGTATPRLPGSSGKEGIGDTYENWMNLQGIIPNGKKSPKGYISYESTCITFWKDKR